MRLLLQILLLSLSFTSFSQAIWINEIHYDNSGTDTNEGVEIVATSGTDLSCYQLIAYNGNGGASYSTLNLTGIVTDLGCGYGAIWFDFSSLQNGSPDGIALYNTCTMTVEQFLSYEGSFTATNGPANGVTSVNIGVTEGSSTLATESLQLSGTGDEYSDFTWTSASASTHDALNTGQTITPCLTAPTISIGTIIGSPFNVDCSTSDNGSINFTTTGTYTSGNTFSVELSDASGDFSNSIVIGTLSGATAEGTDPSGSISITIPSATPSGAGYLIRITANLPSTVSSNTTTTINLTGSCNAPYITSVIINSCNQTCSEGYNELIFGTTGDYAIDVNASNFNISYGSNAPPATNTNYTDLLVNNPTTTANINADAGCPGTFIDATGTTIPAGASFMLANTGLCTEAMQWDGLCGSGPIYVIYTDDANWNPVGTFKNGNTGGLRYFNSSFTTTFGNTFTLDYEYNSTLLQNGSAGDGDFVTFGPSGGAPLSYADDNCTLTPVVLPVELINFSGESMDRYNRLEWTTMSELNSDYFQVNHSSDGIIFNPLTTVQAAGYSQDERYYYVDDHSPSFGMNYYQLVGVDYDGTQKSHGTIALKSNASFAFYNSSQQHIILNESKDIQLFSMDGKLILESTNKQIIPFTETGVFFIVDTSTLESQKLFIHQ